MSVTAPSLRPNVVWRNPRSDASVNGGKAMLGGASPAAGVAADNAIQRELMRWAVAFLVESRHLKSILLLAGLALILSDSRPISNVDISLSE